MQFRKQNIADDLPVQGSQKFTPADYNDMTGVEVRDEYEFKNGAKYKGQWKG